jgi:glycine cleavage system H lipoate-binding protein
VVSVTAPVRLEVQSVNDELMRDPMLIRIDPLGRGWLVRRAVSNTGWDELMLSEGEVWGPGGD